MTSPAQYLLYSHVPVQSGQKLELANRLAGRDRTGSRAHATFAALDDDVVMELTAFESLDTLGGVLAERADAERAAVANLAGEWRHEILAHVEDLVPGEGAITAAPMVEMRHIEVPPPLYSEYRAWRERTIYADLRERPEIDDFRSYQSVMSTRPGVMFVVGFSVNPAIYRGAYQTPSYTDILKQAGQRYIAGGPAGLDCRIFARPDAFADLLEVAA
ncbi:hypothetical protein C8N35_10166 [Breoghania corrubedonensis]|uniref:Chlorite dismutase n=1 Tax=Breoghania corrubedonensis TaxID=665038 RepID=A0A2T5VE57_9HYPH|nr:hypothetical protein [Breoghania corrubedonensis]PTW62034.1 hypothetical protein C8N35_10166 [Breoghania corrubedonensis]